MTTCPDLKIELTSKIGKHVFSYFKTHALRDQFVLGVGGGHMPCKLTKIFTVPYPRPWVTATLDPRFFFFFLYLFF
jgi:hypothetical protein